MIVTARHLQDLHRTNGHVTLPLTARLTPLAQDWLREKKVEVSYDDGQKRDGCRCGCSHGASANPTSVASAARPAEMLAISRASERASHPSTGTLLWWCDGPCGPAKAALMAQGRESSLAEVPVAAEVKSLVPAIRHIAADVKAGRASGAILIVRAGAGAMVYTNRCPSLRAVLATCLESVDLGVREIGANVLVIEHPYKTLSQVRNLIARFVRGPRQLSDDVRRQLQALASCDL